MARPRDIVFKHGRHGYERYGCRCDICRAAIAAHQRDFQSKNREKVREKDVKRYLANPRKQREAQWRRAGLKLDWEQFYEMLKSQNHTCRICGDSIAGKLQDGALVACVDHNHANGQIRGLLCKKCNLMLGYARDSEMILNKGIEYLKEFEK